MESSNDNLKSALQSTSQLYPSSDEEGEVSSSDVLSHKAVMEKFRDCLAELVVVCILF